MAKVKIVQNFQHFWKIVTEQGIVLQERILLTSVEDATTYIKNYCSSFSDWTFEVVPLKKEQK